VIAGKNSVHVEKIELQIEISEHSICVPGLNGGCGKRVLVSTLRLARTLKQPGVNLPICVNSAIVHEDSSQDQFRTPFPAASNGVDLRKNHEYPPIQLAWIGGVDGELEMPQSDVVGPHPLYADGEEERLVWR